MARKEYIFTRPPEGIGLRIDIRVDLESLDKWTPEQIDALFKGLGQLLSASKAEEEEAARDR